MGPLNMRLSYISKHQSLLIAALIGVIASGCAQRTLPPTMPATEIPLGFQMATTRAENMLTLVSHETEIALTPLPTTAPTIAPSATPNVPLATKGPWLLFTATIDPSVEHALWAINQDGTGLTELIHETVVYYAPQPVTSLKDGLLIAYITQPDYKSREKFLKILHWPSREVETITRLINDTDGTVGIEPLNARAAVESNGILWSKDGKRFGFVGQIDGPSMDLYLYTLADKSMQRLSTGEGHAFNLSWSPDERWLIHEAFTLQGMGGPDATGMWAAGMDGSGSLTIFDRAQTPDKYGYVYILRWRDNTHLVLVNEHYEQETIVDIENVDVNTGNATTIFSGNFRDIAYSPEHDVWLMVREPGPDQIEFHQPLAIFKHGQITELGQTLILSVYWKPELDTFWGWSHDGKLFSISVDGVVAELPITGEWQVQWWPAVFASPDNSLWAWFNYDFYDSASELWIGQPMEKPVLINSAHGSDRTDHILWSPDSQRLFMNTGTGLYVGLRPDFTPVPIALNVSQYRWDGDLFQWVHSR